MRTDRVLVAGIVVLGVIAIGSTAASYDAAETVSVSGPGEGEGDGSGSAPPAADRGGASEVVPLPGWVVENFVVLTLGLGTLLFVVGSVVITWLRGLDGLKWVLSRLGEAVASGALYLAIVAFLVWLVFGFTGEGIELLSGSSAESAGGSGGGSGEEGAASSDGRTVPYSFVLVAFFVLFSVGWVYFFHGGGGEETGSRSGSDPEELSDESGVPEPSGPGQETISDVPPSNPVYRAWREMASEAVRTLTRLFEEVRYGDRPVTENRERRAQSALESLERSGGRGT